MDPAHPYGCESARRRSFEVNGIRLSALEWGQPDHPVVCFLHGGSAHKHWFDGIAPAFATRYHVLSLDQRGHGESQWPPVGSGGTPYATPHFVSDLIGVLDALDCRRATICGHSMGGHNSMALAAWRPDRVLALVAVDSRPVIPAEHLDRMHQRGHRGPRRYESQQAAVERFRLLPPNTTADPPLLEHLAREGIVEQDGGFVYRFDPACNGMRRPTDLWPLLERIAAPTLLVRGERSPVLTAAMADEMVRRIPRSRLEVIPNAYHHLVLDEPALFTAAMGRFLAGLPQP
jgi:pimeloyl-ACP methyl ester carboxylesterase